MNVTVIIETYGRLEFEMTSDQVTKMLSSAFGSDPRIPKINKEMKEPEKDVEHQHTTVKPVFPSNTTGSRVNRMFGNDWKNTAPKPKEQFKEFDGVKGFLLLECPECRQRKAFCVKNPIKTSYCSCGNSIPLENLIPAEVKCKCGRTWHYKTNIRDKFLTHNCLDCGSPVDLEYNVRNNRYDTMGGR